jgi:2-methylcitrate dehydratase PrpD
MAPSSTQFDDRTSAETRRLVEFLQDTSAEDIPAEARHESVRCLLDFVGLAVAGATEPATEIVRRQCVALGGEEQSRVLGTATRLRATDAALVNAISAHALDFDDTHVPTILHPTTPLYAAALAFGEWGRARGRDVVAAHTLGYEISARASLALYPEHYDAGWHMTGTTGALASAAVAIRLLGLRGGTAVHCLGVAATQAAGHREHFGTMTKPYHAGHATTAGMWAGLLARDGFTAAPDPLQGRRGMFAVMSSVNVPHELVEDLGARWEIERNGVKPYACGVVIHPAIDAVRNLRVEEGLAPDDIERIELRVHPLVPELTGKTDPRTGLEGKFSVTFAAAVAMIDGRAAEREFTDEAVRRSDVRDLMARMDIVPDPLVAHTKASATATMHDGRVATTVVDHARGTPGNRLSDAELAVKFHDLADGVLGEPRATRLEQAVWSVETADDVAALLALTTPA